MPQVRSNKLTGEYIPINKHKFRGTKWPTYRSSWELRLMKFLDTHDSILEWSSEHLAIPYYNPVDGKMHRYYPDFVITYKDTSGNLIREIIEVKPEKQTIKPEVRNYRSVSKFMVEMAEYVKNSRKWEAAQHYAQKSGCRFRVLTERDLFVG